MAWKDLNMNEKAAFISIAVLNGLFDRELIETAYNRFDEGGYLEWKKAIALHRGWTEELMDNDDYDYEVFYNNDPEYAWSMLTLPDKYHFSDIGKTNMHPTNSNESKASDPDWQGRWDGDKNYYLSKNRAEDPDLVDETLDYVGSDTYDHDVTVHYPDDSIALPQLIVTPKESYSNLRRNKFNTGWVYSDRNSKYTYGGPVNKFDGTRPGPQRIQRMRDPRIVQTTDNVTLKIPVNVLSNLQIKTDNQRANQTAEAAKEYLKDKTLKLKVKTVPTGGGGITPFTETYVVDQNGNEELFSIPAEQLAAEWSAENYRDAADVPENWLLLPAGAGAKALQYTGNIGRLIIGDLALWEAAEQGSKMLTGTTWGGNFRNAVDMVPGFQEWRRNNPVFNVPYEFATDVLSNPMTYGSKAVTNTALSFIDKGSNIASDLVNNINNRLGIGNRYVKINSLDDQTSIYNLYVKRLLRDKKIGEAVIKRVGADQEAVNPITGDISVVDWVLKFGEKYKGVSEDLYSAAITNLDTPLLSGRKLLTPEATTKVWDKFTNKIILNNIGEHYLESLRGNPVVGDAAILYSPSKEVIPKGDLFYIGNKLLGSELNWNPKDWFKTRLSGAYDADDEVSLLSHLLEYYEIERAAKETGMWLKMPDGSTWKGDPRSWVLMQSKDFQEYMKDSAFKSKDGSPIILVHESPNIFDTFDLRYFGSTTDEGFYGRGHYFFPSDEVSGTTFSSRQSYGDNVYNVVSNALNPFALDPYNPNDFSRAFTFNRPESTFNIEPVGPQYDAVSTLPMEFLKYGKYFHGASPGEIVVGKSENLKSILGNNGNFDKTKGNIYKAIVPFILGTSALSLMGEDDETRKDN